VGSWAEALDRHGAGLAHAVPRPGTQPQQAYLAGTVPPPPMYAPPGVAPPPSPDLWNHQALLAALATFGVPNTGPQASEWFLDTGATSHMSSKAGNLSSPLHPSKSPSITVGNGATLPVTHRTSTAIATAHSPLQLNNILVSPSLVKNLISVRSLTRDNNVSVEFDPYVFSIKDLPTRTVMLRCNSGGDLYPLAPSSPKALIATTATADLWHLRLGHPGRHALRQTLHHVAFSCSKSSSHVCSSCQFGKHVRLPFSSSASVSYVSFQIIHADVWTSPVPSCSGFKYYLVLIDDLTHYV